jgi:hypothetical protein
VLLPQSQMLSAVRRLGLPYYAKKENCEKNLKSIGGCELTRNGMRACRIVNTANSLATLERGLQLTLVNAQLPSGLPICAPHHRNLSVNHRQIGSQLTATVVRVA